MHLTSQALPLSWTGLFTVVLMGLQTARAVELNVESDGQGYLIGVNTNDD